MCSNAAAWDCVRQLNQVFPDNILFSRLTWREHLQQVFPHLLVDVRVDADDVAEVVEESIPFLYKQEQTLFKDLRRQILKEKMMRQKMSETS